MEGFRLLAAIIDRAWFCVRRALGQAPGHVVSKFDEDGNLWIGFQCARTGEVRHPAQLLDTLGALGTLEDRDRTEYEVRDGARYYSFKKVSP